ncbi:dUTP diphosphatase [Corynebacterium pyruviciproducens]
MPNLFFTTENDDLTPTRAHKHDAGFDLPAAAEITINPHEMRIIDTGISVQIPHGSVGMLFVRSSIGIKRRCSLANGTGIIDAGYEGNLLVAMVNWGNEPVTFERGERIAQLVIVPLTRINIPERAGMSDALAIGARIKRSEKLLTQVDLAQQIGVHQSTLSNFETGRSNLTPGQLAKLTIVLAASKRELELIGKRFINEQNNSKPVSTAHNERGTGGIGSTGRI